MTAKKKLEPPEPIEVSVASVSAGVEATHEEAIRSNAWRERVWMAAIGAIVALASIGQTVAVTYMQSQTRNAVVEGTSLVKAQTEEVSKDLETYNAKHGRKLDQVVVTSQQNHDLSNSLMLAMKRRLAERSRRLAEKTMDPADVTEAEIAEEAYLAHKKTHDEMQAREKAEIKND